MIPIGDDNYGQRGAAWLNWLIIAANVFVYIFVQDFGADERTTLHLALIPAVLFNGGGFFTLITSMFLHGGLLHLAGNMLFLGIFGDNVECRIGRVRYLILYLCSGLLGAAVHIASIFVSPYGYQTMVTPLVGASGAISGILGAYLVLFPGNRVTVLLFNFFPTALSAWMVIGFWFVMQIAGGLVGWSSSGVAYLVHIGGFVTGWLWSRGYRRRERERIIRERQMRIAAGRRGAYPWWMIE